MEKKQHLKGVVNKEIKEKIPKKYRAIYEALGKFKGTMPSSEDFLRRKQEEKLLDK